MPQWRVSPDQVGPVRVLTWGGIARNTPQWPQRWAALYRGSVHLLEHKEAIEPLDSWNIWNGRSVDDVTRVTHRLHSERLRT